MPAEALTITPNAVIGLMAPTKETPGDAPFIISLLLEVSVEVS